MILSLTKRWGNLLCIVSLTFLFVNLSSAQDYNNPGGTITTCSGNFNDIGGTANSYNNNEFTTTSICPTNPNDCVSVNFNSFDVENNYDFLYINQGVNTGTGSALAYTGSNSPGVVSSYDPSGCLTFIFTSDGSITNPGWSGSISCGTCGTPPPASSADCVGAIPICSNVISVPSLSNGEGAFPNEYNAADPNMCLDTESQSTWYIFTANATGDFGFLLTPNNTLDDFDWAVFDLSNASCADIFNNTSSLLVSCNASGGDGFNPNACSGATGASGGSAYSIQGAGCNTCPPSAAQGCSTENAVIPVVTGNTYVLYVSNWSGSGGGYSLDFSQSTVGIIDVTPPTLDQVYQPIACGATEITFEFSENVVCSSVQTTDFTLSGPGGPYTVTNISNPGCDAGSNFGKVFTATITPPLTSNGTYSLSIIDDVTDNCGNITPTNTLTFDITNLADASFSYPSSTYCQSAIDPTPSISTPGGTFTFTPTGLVINSTGTIDLDASAAGVYTITYEVNDNGCMASETQQITISTGTTTTITTPNTQLDCDNPTAVLDAGAGFSMYNWSNGTSNQTTTVASSGTYSVTVTDVNGCTGTASINITEDLTSTPTTITSLHTELTCTTLLIDLAAASGFDAYTWSNAVTTQTNAVNSPGTYTVTATDNTSGCTSTASIVITENITPPSTTISSITTELDCDNPAIILDAGAGFDSYIWSNADITQTITVINPGTYSVTITDAQNGCTSTADITITENTTPPSTTITSASTELTCTNTSILLDAGAGFDAYEWSTGEVAQTITVNSIGTYSVTVTDNSNGCTTEASIIITQDMSVPSTNITAPTTELTCDVISISLDAGAGFDSYAWSTTETTQNISILAIGTYSVTVTDNASGCTSSTSIIITENITQPSTTITSASTELTCTNTSILLDAGAGFSNYLWSTGDNTQTTTITSIGTYVVTVTDAANGCTGTASITITENTTPPSTTISSIITELNCDNPAIILDAGTGFDSYIWSNADITQTITVINPGTYSVTVTDAQNGCTSIADITITENTTPPSTTITSASTELTCTNTSILLNAGAGFDAYEWSNGEMAQTITVNSMGTYSVTVTDNSNGCTAEASIIITQDMSIPSTNITAPTTELTCDLTSISLDAGVGFDSYAWSTTETTQNISISAIGTYSVTVTDNASGCTSSASITITENITQPSTTITSASTELTCTNTSILLDAGSGFSNYLWSTGNNTQTTTITSIGTYIVTVTDAANGCTGTASITITENTTPPSTTISSITTELDCDNPAIILDAGAGFGNYVWSNAETSQTITVINTGTYSVTVTDVQNGCTSTANITITESTTPPSTTITSASTELTCTNTSILLDAGAGFDAYEWSTGEMAQTITVNSMGTYSVTITDNSNGCTAEAFITITENISNPSTTITAATTELTCDVTSITLDAGAGFSTYAWSNSATSQTIIVNSMGTYSITVTDGQNGCTTTADIIITQDNSLPSAVIIPSETEFNCVINSIDLDASTSIGNNLSYEWQDASTNPSLTISTIGDYSVTITDGNTGCTSSTSITIGMNDTAPTFTMTPQNPVLDCTAPCTTLFLGISNSDVIWDDGSTADTLLVCSPGTYAVTITDSNNGCTASSSVVVISSNTPPDVMINSITTVLDCVNTSLTLNTSGSANVDYEWSTGEISTSIIINTPGTYAVTATDTNTGCISADNITITESVISMPTITGDLEICNGESTTLDAATAGMTSYIWSTGETSSSILVSSAGEYGVTVSDGTCDGTASVMVIEATISNPIITGDAIICEGDNTTLDAGLGFDSYLWSNAMTDQMITVTEAGTYAVTVTNMDGCESSSSFQVLVNASPTYNVIDDLNICGSGSIVIGTINASGTNYSWTSEPNDSSLDDPTNATPSVSPTETTTYYLTATNGICSEIDSVTITVEDPIVTAENTSICQGDIVIISAEGTPTGGTYVWTDWEGNEVGTGESINVDPSTTTSYLVTYSVDDCNVSTVVEVNVVTDPNISITASSTDVFAGESTTLEVENTPTGSTIIWSSNNGDNLPEDAAIVVNPLENTLYTVEITTPEGCVYTAEILISVTQTELSIPNIFTPNGDDLNDLFYLVNLDASSKVTEFKIFDRWGTVIHNAPNTPWNGSFKGKEMPSDIYVYLIRIEMSNGTEEFFKGDVALVR